MNSTQKLSLRIGNQTSFAAAWPLEPFEFAVSNGFTAFEFFPDRGPAGNAGWHEDDLNDSTRAYIRQTASDKKIEVTVHAPLEFNPLHNPDDPRLRSTIDFAKAIGATLVNLHLDVTDGAEQFAEALAETLQLTAEAKLKLAIENTVWTGPEDFNLFFSALRHGGQPHAHAGMCFDLGHANLFGETQNDYWQYLNRLSFDVPIIHVHLHENFGESDSHLPLFTGPSRENTLGIEGVLARLRDRNFSGCAILEQWPQPPTLLTEARDRLMKLISKSGANAGRSK
jgi:sugar phosphate isomerase/epimerase